MARQLRIRKQLLSLLARSIGSLIAGGYQRRVPSGVNCLLSFYWALPPASRAVIADDVKLLIAWTSQAASRHDEVRPGRLVNTASTFAHVPGFTRPVEMSGLKAVYRVDMPPLKASGYYGVVLTMLGKEEKPIAVILVNRLFRLPFILREPAGVITDIVTVGALLTGIWISAIDSSINAAVTAFTHARSLGVPLVACGQSLAGGLAQFQVAALVQAHPMVKPLTGFLTFNAAHAAISIERLGLNSEDIPGINFSKDRDPGVGPRSLLPNRTGLQIYVHPDGTGGFVPGTGSLLSALLHPWEHFLGSFKNVSLGKIIKELGIFEPGKLRE